MHSKYARLKARRTEPRDDRAAAPQPATGELHGTRWDDRTYSAARELVATASRELGWMPFSAPGLSVGPSMLRNHLRVDLLDQHGAPRSLLVTSDDLARWLAVVR